MGAARVTVDEADIVLAAATAWRVDPAWLLARCDLPSLISIAGDASCARSAVDAAATVLAGILDRRPFRATGRDHQVVAWFACCHLLARAGIELAPTARERTRLLDEVNSAVPDLGAVRHVLATFSHRRPSRLVRWARRALRPRSVVIRRWECPGCDRPVLLGHEDAVAVVWLGVDASRPLLRSRCGCSRIQGCPTELVEDAPPRAIAGTAGLPVVAAPHGPEGALLALGPGGAVAFVPWCGPGPEETGEPGTYEVAAIAEPSASDLVGDWRRLVASSARRTAVRADAVRLNSRTGHLDLAHLAAEAPEAAKMLVGHRVVVGVG